MRLLQAECRDADIRLRALSGHLVVSRAAISHRADPGRLFADDADFCRYRVRESCHPAFARCPYRWRCGTDAAGWSAPGGPGLVAISVADAGKYWVVLEAGDPGSGFARGVDFAEGSSCSTSPGVRG